MSEDPIQYTGTGSETDPITVSTRQPAPDQVDVAVAGLARTARAHAAAFSDTADMSSNLPADLRDIVRDASMAITGTLNTAMEAQRKAHSFRNDLTLYPQGREMLAGEAIKTAADKVTQSFEQADTQIEVATALSYEAARPRIAPDDAMPARADLVMLTQRNANDTGALVNTMKRLAQRNDGVGALVADQGFLADFIDAHGIDPQMRAAILTMVSAEVVQAAAKSGDPRRSAAARTNLALIELRKARIAADSYTRHVLQR
ncbi:hypothetical protein QQM39_26180 [Streptomyces sp. DT2A-34]|uniref:hypothetical protein n=1 Tax=Streptomyces sp. DT2A-34 TaxID=3051182 RepID=UPI00265B8B81|nr:hypothetical protein [Streptomyces sp. DT2A-34]MDO0913013.1 hypothetical protein [Streptomyces sp. DT2A-34]MDO0914190.1 hypothetical protein [Streptomyces sp. DT2A-34]